MTDQAEPGAAPEPSIMPEQQPVKVSLAILDDAGIFRGLEVIYVVGNAEAVPVLPDNRVIVPHECDLPIGGARFDREHGHFVFIVNDGPEESPDRIPTDALCAIAAFIKTAAAGSPPPDLSVAWADKYLASFDARFSKPAIPEGR